VFHLAIAQYTFFSVVHGTFSRCCWENIFCIQKTETRSTSAPGTSISSKWIKGLVIRPETLKLVQERTGNTLELIGIGNDFLSRTQMVQLLRERIDKCDYMKLISLHNKRNGHQILQAGHRMGENLCHLYI
jgi:hypothetical protein